MSCEPRPYSRPSRSTRIERRAHALDADGVDVPAEHQRAARARALEHADDIRPSRRDFLHCDVEAEPRACAAAIASRNRPSPAAPGTSDGLTESIATRSRSSVMARDPSWFDHLNACRGSSTANFASSGRADSPRGAVVLYHARMESLRTRGGNHRRFVRHRAGLRAAARAQGVAVVLGARRARSPRGRGADDPRARAAGRSALVMDVTSRADVARPRRAGARCVRPARHHDLQCRVRLLRHARGDAGRRRCGA